ncbi:MAG: dicarboxylate/amino acid:cation symporter [Candidatus Kapaibacterium sp.]|nr:dicarboxylate/amino acid:cation symporter [Ignavibacteriota bacterium]MCB9220819.1 dicarboxylate/amino acid:cation symporter [Ignavibacteria bacterium]
MKKVPLHIQILLALILGAAFGAFFSINKNKLEITYKKNSNQVVESIKNWNSGYLIANDSTIAKFSSNDQIAIINKFKHLYSNSRESIKLTFETEKGKFEYTDVVAVKKEHTLATYIKPVGDLFIRLLSFLAIPLVISTLIVGAASLTDFKKLGRIGIKTFSLYLLTTTIAITIGLGLANIISPGTRIDPQSKERLMSSFQEESAEKAVETLDISIVDFFVEIVPKNPFDAISNGNMLQIVFLAVIFGITLTLIEKSKRETVLKFFDGVSDTMIKMVDLFMLIAPYGVFALIAATIADFGFEILTTLIWYIVAVILGLFVQTYVVYGSLLKFLGKASLKDFFLNIRNAQAIGFSTSSSAATLPITLDCVENKMNTNKEIAGFVLPLGATINMDGTALYQGVAAVFIAQVYGFDLTVVEQMTIVLTAVLASVGTAPVPGVGIIMLVMILNAINIPAQGIALILGVDRILDMLRTITNVTGDAAVAVTVANTEKNFTIE